MKNIFKCLSKNICIIIFIIFIFLIISIFQKIFIFIGLILNEYSDAIIALSAILGLIFGQSWLDTSKKKMRDQLYPDIARKYLKTVLELRDSIKIVRNPFISSGEIQNAFQKNENNTNDYNDRQKQDLFVYSLRWNKVQESWTKFEEILLESEVFWGDEAVNIQKDFDMLIRKLRSVVWLFINAKESYQQKLQENNNILYGTHDENDEFAKEINQEIDKIRLFLKEYL